MIPLGKIVFTSMPNQSMAVKDSCQEQGDEVLAFPVSREERKSVV